MVTFCSIRRDRYLSPLEVSCPRWGGVGGNALSGADSFVWQVAIWLESPTSRLPERFPARRRAEVVLDQQPYDARGVRR